MVTVALHCIGCDSSAYQERNSLLIHHNPALLAPSTLHYLCRSLSGSTPICSAIFSRLLRVRLRSPRSTPPM